LAACGDLEDDLATLYATLAQKEHQEATEELCALRASLETLEERLLLNQDEVSKQSALVIIRASTREQTDELWATELLRMYGRWAESRQFQIETVAFSEGNRGFSETNVHVQGRSAFALLRGEAGTHHLLDQSGPREAAASAEVMVFPLWRQFPPNQINPETLEVTTHRRGVSCGCLHRTSSAVRVLHRPSGRSIVCDWFRTQTQNREWALYVLAQQLSQAHGAPRKRRTYTLGERSFVRDHSTGLEDGEPQRVLDGYLDPFVRASLREPLRLLKIE
jgi:peptide chain release factor 2